MHKEQQSQSLICPSAWRIKSPHGEGILLKRKAAVQSAKPLLLIPEFLSLRLQTDTSNPNFIRGFT